MHDLTYEFYIAAKPEDVFAIFVEPEGTRQIFHGSVVESTFVAGDGLQYVGPGIPAQRGKGGNGRAEKRVKPTRTKLHAKHTAFTFKSVKRPLRGHAEYTRIIPVNDEVAHG